MVGGGGGVETYYSVRLNFKLNKSFKSIATNLCRPGLYGNIYELRSPMMKRVWLPKKGSQTLSSQTGNNTTSFNLLKKAVRESKS